MTLCYAAILPHGDVIPELAGANAYRTLPTHEAMTAVGQHLKESKPDTVLIATPHGVRIEDRVCISVTERASGSLSGSGATVAIDLLVDWELAHEIADEAMTRGVPMARCVFGTLSGPESKLPLDWGSIVPLWYCGERWAKKPKLVVVTPSRSVDESRLIEFGRAAIYAARRQRKRVAFIASCDWAHAQAADGPYGHHPDAARYDALVKEIVASGDLTRFKGIDEQFIENAKPDGNWQALMLAGALEGSSLRPEVLSYQCPTYFGMLVASFRSLVPAIVAPA